MSKYRVKKAMLNHLELYQIQKRYFGFLWLSLGWKSSYEDAKHAIVEFRIIEKEQKCQ